MNKERLEENELRKFLHNTIDVMTFEQLRSVAQSIGLIDPEPIPIPTLKPGDKVLHESWGEGNVFAIDQEDPNIAIVDFDEDGLLSVLCQDLEVQEDVR